MSEISIDDVIRKYIGIREQRSELKRAFDAKDMELKDQQERIEKWLLVMQRRLGVTQTKSSAGIAFQVPKTLYTCVDWGAFHRWIVENNRPDLLEKRIGQRAMKEFREETNTIPPGLNVYSDVEISIRKGT